MIEIKNLTKEFSIGNKIFKAIDNVSITIPKKKIFGIIGLSGAGKSTLVRCINRLEEPSEGKVIIDNININALNSKELLSIRKDIGMIFQNFNLFNQKDVFENIAYPLRLTAMSKKDIDNRVNELLKFIDLEDKKRAYPSELSGGQKQRVAIARAIATKPKILLCDEATSALDPSNTHQVLELIKKAVLEFDMTVVMITHQMEVAKEICDIIAVMKDGKIVEVNDAKTIFRSPKHSITRSFVDAININNEERKSIDYTKYEGRVFRIAYNSETTDIPVISRCIKKFDIDINLISGNINVFQEERIGHMYIEFLGDYQKVNSAIEYLKENSLIVEGVNE